MNFRTMAKAETTHNDAIQGMTRLQIETRGVYEKRFPNS